MPVIVTYTVDQDLYHKPDVKHDVSLVTTQYRYRTDLLTHTLLGNDLNIRLNDRLSDLLEAGSLPKEQYFFNKTYRQDKIKLIARGTFEETPYSAEMR